MVNQTEINRTMSKRPHIIIMVILALVTIAGVYFWQTTSNVSESTPIDNGKIFGFFNDPFALPKEFEGELVGSYEPHPRVNIGEIVDIPEEGFEMYSNKVFNFQIKFPQGWSLKDSQPRNKKNIVNFYVHPASVIGGSFWSVSVEKKHDAVVDDEITYILSILQGVELSRELIELDGKEAVKVRINSQKSSDTGDIFSYDFIIVVSNDYVYRLLGRSSKDYNFEIFYNSFEFIN